MDDMRLDVHFVFNPATGIVEEFVIAGSSSDPDSEEHEEEHDRAAEEIGGQIDRSPTVTQIVTPRDESSGPSGRVLPDSVDTNEDPDPGNRQRAR